MNTQWKFHVCGSRGSHSVFGPEYQEFGGATTCFILKKDDYALIVDCGSGLMNAKDILKDCKQIDIFLTHVHYDHVIGILGWSVFPTDAKIRFFGTFEEWLGKESIHQLFKQPFWPITPDLGECISIAMNGCSKLTDEVEILYVPACHPNAGSSIKIKLGNKYISILVDFEHGLGDPVKAVEDCDILVYDGMFTTEEYLECKGWGHSTWNEGVRIAKAYHAKRLLITHHSPERTDAQLRKMEEEARKEFPNLRFCRMYDVEDI